MVLPVQFNQVFPSQYTITRWYSRPSYSNTIFEWAHLISFIHTVVVVGASLRAASAY
jgi:hypothetical protein